ncbi:MAG: Phosphoglycerate dehydrogenase [Devosia sp.]|uniref:2-hydroxyacid dehydrogenase n=1 Tax=Devosia sp. TaxID=1871048 RepID=UPI00262A8463|nr:2-hydroxyacid dehydrogenase [Devosia sp.]MDB5540812.1 Phosphoglycerate dehydrogenase [Devosia sp.]
MLPDVLITQPQPKSCVDALRQHFTVHTLVGATDPEAVLAEIGDRVRGIAGGKVTGAMIGRLPRLEIIAASGAGTDSIDVATARTRGIRVTNTPDVLNDAVAEITIGLMVALSRRLPQSDRFIRTGEWLKGQFPLGREIGGKTLGILGLGGIGKEIARRAEAMKMNVIYFGRTEQPVPYRYYADLVAMARAAEWLVVIAPGGKATEKIVSREVLEALGPNGMLVNVARGSLVDQEALVDLLVAGGLGGAALDVFDKEPGVPEALLSLDNVVLSPHQGGRTVESREAVGAIVVENLVAHFAGKPLFSPVA